MAILNSLYTLPALLLGSSVVNAQACTKPLPTNVTIGTPHSVSIVSSDVTRTYLIVVPSLYSVQTVTPVIFSFHGGDRTAQEQLDLDEISKPYFNNGSITIYPQGINEKWEGDPKQTANDTQLVSDIIDSIGEDYCIDSKRIWATGKSDGGGFCNTLACDPILSTKIAAFAPVSAAIYLSDVAVPCDTSTVAISTAMCNPGRAHIPMLEFHGGLDTTIAYEGNASRSGECVPSVPHWIQLWAARDGLPASNVTSRLTDDTVVYTFGEGDTAGLVMHVFDEDLEHDWPSTVLNDDLIGHGEGPASYNATPIILEWFTQYVLP